MTMNLSYGFVMQIIYLIFCLREQYPGIFFLNVLKSVSKVLSQTLITYNEPILINDKSGFNL